MSGHDVSCGACCGHTRTNTSRPRRSRPRITHSSPNQALDDGKQDAQRVIEERDDAHTIVNAVLASTGSRRMSP